MGDQFITDMVSKIGGYLMDLTINELRPVFQFKSIVEDLKHKSDNLCSKQRTIQDKICRAKQNSEAINDDVRKWVSDVEDILKRVQNLEEKLRPNKRWLCGQCPNMIWRYHLGKDAMKEMAAIKMLQQEGDFGQVSHHTIVDVNIPSQETLFESTESAFDQIMEALKSDDCNLVGLYGIGGVGKTTLAQEVRARATELKLFDNIVMVVVSQNPNFSAIQDEIAERLGLKIEEKVKEARASRLSSRLKQEKKILIILDDVWGDLDLANDIGIPHGDDHKGCKILLTTRRLHVCKSMGSKKNIELAALKYEDARALFEKSADLTDKSPELNEIVKEVVRECKGLPLAIVAVGKALREKTLDEYKRALNQLKDARLDEIEDVDKEVYKSLMLSYDYLKSKQTKSCFLLCSIFPEDYKIEIEELVMYGMGLQLFKASDSFEERRSQIRAIIETLKDSSLLLGTSEQHIVKMHDVVRDAASWIASRGDNEKWPETDDERLKQYTAISLMGNRLRVLPDKLECPKLKILLLDGEESMTVPETFFQGMKDLKVVALNGGLLFLKSLECLTNLQMLRLQYCTIKDNTNSLGKLKSLEVLRISNSDIKELPIEVGELSKLRVMDFSWCSKLKRIPPDVIRRLSLLEELYFCGKSFRGWEIERRSSERSNASLSELNSLPNLKVLYGEFHISSLPQDFSFGNLDRYDISLRGSDIFPEHLIIASATRYPPLCRRLSIHDTNASSVVNTAFNKLYENVEFLELYLFNNAQEQVSVPTTASSSLMDMIQTETTNLRALQKLKSLSVSFCNNMGCILPEKLLRRLQDLEAMEVDQCYGVQEIFGLEGSTDHGIEGDQEMLLSNLTSLSLAVLPQLSFIWKGPTQKVSLRCLVRVNVFDCHGLAYLFPRSLALNLVNLRELGIISCKGLKQIISMRAEEDGEAATHHQPHPLHFPTLTTLTIQNCPNLEYIFPISTAAGGLPQLETLVIADATKLKHVFGHGRVFVGDPNDISLPKLNKLVLGHLLSLTNFCQANFHCKWPSLPHVVVNRCPMLTSLPYVEVEKCPTSQLLGIQKTTQLVKEEMAEGPSTSQTSVATSDPTSVI